MRGMDNYDAIRRLEKTICWKILMKFSVLTLQITFKITLEIFSTGQFNSRPFTHRFFLTTLNAGLASWNDIKKLLLKLRPEIKMYSYIYIYIYICIYLCTAAPSII